jgi:hypothetical protein
VDGEKDGLQKLECREHVFSGCHFDVYIVDMR